MKSFFLIYRTYRVLECFNYVKNSLCITKCSLFSIKTFIKMETLREVTFLF